MFRQFFPAPAASRDRDGSGAERFSAANITRRVADDVDLLRGKFAAVLFLRPGAGKCSELVAIVEVVGNFETFFQGKLEGLNTGAARMNQGAVDIEKQ